MINMFVSGFMVGSIVGAFFTAFLYILYMKYDDDDK